MSLERCAPVQEDSGARRGVLRHELARSFSFVPFDAAMAERHNFALWVIAFDDLLNHLSDVL
jgi:hypothetical protein